jgi:hypothetical protein
MSEQKTPKELDAIVDKVLAYRPKPKSDAAKKRKRKEPKKHRIRQDEKQPTTS